MDFIFKWIYFTLSMTRNKSMFSCLFRGKSDDVGRSISGDIDLGQEPGQVSCKKKEVRKYLVRKKIGHKIWYRENVKIFFNCFYFLWNTMQVYHLRKGNGEQVLGNGKRKEFGTVSRTEYELTGKQNNNPVISNLSLPQSDSKFFCWK